MADKQLDRLPQQMKEQEFYHRLREAETGSEKDRWIRTKVKPKEGSSAFGEVQITKRLVDEALDDPERYNLDLEDAVFLDRLSRMQDTMLQYGGSDMKPGYEAYDYGGKGDFKQEEIYAYRKAIGKISNRVLMDNDYELEKARREWRHGRVGARTKPVDADHQKRFDNELDMFWQTLPKRR